MRDAHNYLLQKRQALLAASSLFWLPSGMSQANVLAAYQFKGVGSEGVALRDLSGNAHMLSKGSQTYNGTSHTPSWNASTGFTFDAVYGGNSGYLHSASLCALNIKAAVVRFSDVTQNNRCCLITAGGANGTAQLMAACTYFTNEVVNGVGPGYVSVWGVYENGTPNGYWDYNPAQMTSGVLGANFGTAVGMYRNGTNIVVNHAHACSYLGNNTSQPEASWVFGNTHASKSDLNNAVWAGKKIQAAAFFSVALSAAQHKEVAERMAEL